MRALSRIQTQPEERKAEIPVPASGGPVPADLKGWQREALAARLVVLNEIEWLAKTQGISLHKAIKAFLASLSHGASEHVRKMAVIANNRGGESRTLSDKTIYRWFKILKEDGKQALAPQTIDRMNAIPAWFPEFLCHYRQPSKPSIPEALRAMGPDAPAEHKVRAFLKRFSNVDLQRGRMTGSELRAIRAYTVRDFSHLSPMDVVVADGHSFKAYVSHPVHGKRFLPEVEAVVDVATRACVGWSTGLAESGQVVADALRHVVTISEDKPMGGLFAILYTDNGAGNRAKMNADEVTGIVARIGGTVKFGIAGNPQGRGVIERLNKSLWIPSARKLLTYNGKDMDSGAQRKRLKIVDKDLKEKGTSTHLLTWRQFIDFIGAEVQAYNNRPHSSLPKISGPNGLKRHMTPSERWQEFMTQGWRPDTLNPEDIAELFRPQIECLVRRGTVTVFGNVYCSTDLEPFHGERVFVNYDLHEWRIVWVRDKQQRFICEAQWNANKRQYFPISVVEQARAKRAERREQLLQDKIQDVRAEAMGCIEGDADCYPIPEEAVVVRATFRNAEEAPLISSYMAEADSPENVGGEGVEAYGDTPLQNDRPFFEGNIERYEWHLQYGVFTEEDTAWCAWFRTTNEFKMLFMSYETTREGGKQ